MNEIEAASYGIYEAIEDLRRLFAGLDQPHIKAVYPAFSIKYGEDRVYYGRSVFFGYGERTTAALLKDIKRTIAGFISSRDENWDLELVTALVKEADAIQGAFGSWSFQEKYEHYLEELKAAQDYFMEEAIKP